MREGPVEITTARLRLRKVLISDLPALSGIMSDHRAMRYWSTPAHSSLQQTREWLQALIERPAHIAEEFVIELDGRIIGELGVHLGEFGLILHADFWGRGFGYEASAAVIRHVFSKSPVEQLTADADPRNAGSLALLMKLGFRKTGEAERTFLIDGEWADSVYFPLDRPVSISD